jgi:hypothetical protein
LVQSSHDAVAQRSALAPTTKTPLDVAHMLVSTERLRRRRQQNKTSSAYLQSTRKPLLHARHKHRFNQIKSNHINHYQSKARLSRHGFCLKSLSADMPSSLSLFFLRLAVFSVLYCVIHIVPSTGCNLAALARRGPWGAARQFDIVCVYST